MLKVRDDGHFETKSESCIQYCKRIWIIDCCMWHGYLITS